MSAREEALPYYKWLWRDFRSNRKVQRMGWVARGLYRELIDEAWAEGSIPNDMTELADICGCPVEAMTEAWPQIEPCWHLDESNHWISDKLESLRTEVDTTRVTKARAGRIGGLTKLKNKLEASQADVSKVEQKLADAKHVLDPATECHIAEHKQEQSKSTSKVSEAKASSPRNDSGKPETRPEEYANSWNRLRGPLPKVMEFTDSRKRKVAIRQRQGISLEAFEKAVAKCAQDPFLSGDSKQGWKASFDWLIENDANLLKVLEGKYDKGESNGTSKGNSSGDGTRGAAVGRVERSQNAFRAAALASVEASGGFPAGPDDSSVSEPGAPPRHSADVSARGGDVGGGVRDQPRAGGSGVISHAPEILPPSQRNTGGPGSHGSQRAH